MWMICTLGVKLLNDKFGIQTRGGAVVLVPMDTFVTRRPRNVHKLIDEITLGDLIRKPGWIRMSVHPTTTNAEIEFVCTSIKALAENHKTGFGLYL
jgi:selenocysteine lyase/cysteine desulfurase